MQPDALVKAWSNEVQPWEDAVVARAPFFNLGDFMDIEEPPEESMLKFYYDEKMRGMLDKLKNDAYNRQPPFQYPYESTFGASRMADFSGRNMTKVDVKKNLKRIKFADSMLRMLMTAKAVQLKTIDFWPPRTECDGMLGVLPIGLDFSIMMKDLTAFLDSLRMNESRYFTVSAISIQNTNLLTPMEPVLDVQMLLLQAYFIEKESAPAAPAAPAVGGPGMGQPGMGQPGMGQPGMGQPAIGQPGAGQPGAGQQNMMSRKNQEDKGPPPTKFQTWWRNFRRNYLPF
jgi:hypothetical protein